MPKLTQAMGFPQAMHKVMEGEAIRSLSSHTEGEFIKLIGSCVFRISYEDGERLKIPFTIYKADLEATDWVVK